VDRGDGGLTDMTTTEAAQTAGPAPELPRPHRDRRGRRRVGDPTGARRFGLQLAGAPGLWLLVFLVLPMILMLLWSFRPAGMGSLAFTGGEPLTLETYRRNLSTGVFIGSLVRTIGMVGIVAAAAVILAYPLAYLLAWVAGPRRYVLLSLIVAPALVSYMLRLFAWRTLLGSGGVFNTTLQRLGLIDGPLEFLLYNRFAVILVLTYIWLPFAALPIFARLEQVNPNLLAAARDLGATPARTFRRVTFPLSLPGVYAAFFFVFIPTLGDFATAALVGGNTGRMYGNVIRGIVGSPDFPSAAVLSILLFAVAGIAMVIAFRVMRIEAVTDLA
jgi:spermidine/putrescine transport system permease protein